MNSIVEFPTTVKLDIPVTDISIVDNDGTQSDSLLDLIKRAMEEESGSFWSKLSDDQKIALCGTRFKFLTNRHIEIRFPIYCHLCDGCLARQIKKIEKAAIRNSVSGEDKKYFREKTFKADSKELAAFKKKVSRHGGVHSQAAGVESDTTVVTVDLPAGKDNDDLFTEFGEKIDKDIIDWEGKFERTKKAGKRMSGKLIRRKSKDEKQPGEVVESPAVILNISDRDQADELLEQAKEDKAGWVEVSNATEYHQAQLKLHLIYTALLKEAGLEHYEDTMRITITDDDIENHNRDVRVRRKLSKVKLPEADLTCTNRTHVTTKDMRPICTFGENGNSYKQ